MISKLEGSNYVVIDGGEFEELKRQIDSPYLEKVAKHAKEHGHVLVRSKDLAEQSNHDVEDLGPLTKEGAFLLLNAEEYDSLLNSNIDRLGQRDLLRMCEKLGMIPVPKAEFEELSSTPDTARLQEYATELGLVAISQEDFDGMVSELEKPLEQSVHSFVEQHNLLLIEKNSYENLLVKLNNPTKAELEKHSEKLGHVLVPSKQYETLVKQFQYKSGPPSSSPQQGLHETKENRNPETSHNSNVESSTLRTSNEEDNKASNSTLTSAFSKSDIYRAAESLNLTVLSADEYKSLSSRRSQAQAPNLEDMQDYASRLNMKLVPSTGQDQGNSASQLRMSTDSTSTDSMHFKNNSTTTIDSDFTNYFDTSEGGTTESAATQKLEKSKETYGSNSQSVAPSPEQIKGVESSSPDSISRTPGVLLTSSTEPLNIKTLKEKVAEMGYELVPSSETNQTPKKSKNAEVEDTEDWFDADNFENGSKNEVAILAKKAEKLGLTLASSSGYQEDPNQKIEKSNLETISNQAARLGLVVLEEGTLRTLESKAKNSKERLEQLAGEFGYHLLRDEEYSLLRKQLQETELNINNIPAKAQELGYYVLNEQQYEELKDTAIAGKKELTLEEFKKKAAEFDLVPLSATAYDELVSKRAAEPRELSEEDIKRRASALGLTTIPNSIYKSLLSKQVPQEVTEENLAATAQKLGMKLVDEKSKWTKNDVIQASEKFGLVTLDRREFTKLQRLTKPESLKDRAQAANMICLPRNAVIASPERTNPDDVVVIPTAYYKKLLSREASMISARKQQVEMSKPSARPPQRPVRQESVRSTQSGRPVPKIREQRSLNSLRGSTRSATGAGSGVGTSAAAAATASSSNASYSSSREVPIPRTNSMGALSLSTIESLDEPSIIPALTQTVIGEYLYKYYQPFGVGGESRHERYFWVHPYSMTLYWSPTNPVVENPANHSAKCAPIVKVDSIIDTNPTQGIYHKCLVITTDTRVIKIACPTRQRHNVWYNSLRYLLQRSMDGISLEDIAENPNDTMYSGKIFALSKQPSKKVPKSTSSSFLRSKH
ncbi:hypothetical protein ZYGR_0AS04540 [Zygosaccharomyces rouxii]|uniref:PH domain-containing protein n=1 Tax=Zygosaccharomyces rouxii TaxID=4956 RepID=A0A1Q3AHF5_ZYGRO|nr:hypothetical protein ZYGR_0AS04540 [Zygosaccharomyces rouxii]